MKWLLLLLSFPLLIVTSVKAQRAKLYRSVIYTSQGEQINGILYDMTDSTVQYIPNRPASVKLLRDGMTPTVFDIRYDTINRIVIRRKNQVVRGIVTGGVIGGLSLLPLATGGNSASGLEVIGYAAFATVGSLTGILYGTIRSLVPHRVHRIRHNAATFRSAQPELKLRSFVRQQRQTRLPR